MYVDMFVQIFIFSSLTCGFPCHMRWCWNMATDPSGARVVRDSVLGFRGDGFLAPVL